MGKGFGISLLDKQEKTRYTHEELISRYLISHKVGGEYLRQHIGYFIKHSNWGVHPTMLMEIASDAWCILDPLIKKQIDKFGYDCNPVKIGKYLIMRLRGGLMNKDLSEKKHTFSSSESNEYLDAKEVGGDFILDQIGLTKKEKDIVLRFIEGYTSTDIIAMTGINKSSILKTKRRGFAKIKNYYSKFVKNETSIKEAEGGLQGS